MPKNAKKAVHWFYIAAEQGNAEARCRLGRTLKRANLRLLQEPSWSQTQKRQHVGANQESSWDAMYEKESNDPASEMVYALFSYPSLFIIVTALLSLYMFLLL